MVTDVDEYGVMYRKATGTNVSRAVLARAYMTHIAIQRAKGRSQYTRARWSCIDDIFTFAVPKEKKEHGREKAK